MRYVHVYRSFECLESSAWALAYLGAAAAVGVGVALPQFSWLTTVTFAVALPTLVIHVVRASLTRNLPVVRVVLGLNVVVFAAASLVRDRLSTQVCAAIVASVPMLSYFLYWAHHLALAPPRPGEALRPPKLLRECNPFFRIASCLVLLIEFVQFNALCFNPALGAWKDLGSLAATFKASFFVFESSEELFEKQLWAYCALAVGWVLFALIVLLISRPRSLTGPGDAPRYTRPDAEIVSSAHYTERPPVALVIRFIIGKALDAARAHKRNLRAAAGHAERAAFFARGLRSPCLSGGALVLVFAACVAAAFAGSMLTFGLAALVALCCVCGLAVCGAFAAINLLHFPILMNMLSVLRCDYTDDGASGSMSRMPSIQCWHGRHWLFAGASVITLALLYPMMIHFERKRQSANEVSYHVRFTACMLVGKLALSACSALLLPALPPPAYLLLCACLLLFFLYVNNKREQDDQPACCNVRSVRLLRSMVLTCALWTTTVTLTATVLSLPDLPLALGLGALWLLTALFFGAIILLPQHEPKYSAEPPQLSAPAAAAKKQLVVTHTTPRSAPRPPRDGAPPASGSCAEARKGSATGATAAGSAAAPTAAPAAAGSAGSAPPAAAAPGSAAGGAVAFPFADLGSLRKRHGRGPLSASGPPPEASGCRTVWLSEHPSARPHVSFYAYDDGFDGAAAVEGVAFDGEGANAPRPSDLLPIVLSATPSSAEVGSGGSYGLSASGGDDVLRAGDVVVGVNGERAPGAMDLAERLESIEGALQLTVRPAPLRSSGTKTGPPAASLAGMRVRTLTQCLLLYPQDAELQRAGCDQLRRALVGSGVELSSLICEVQTSAVLPVVVNAMEVHRSVPQVLTAAAKLLRCLAATGGSLRANVVAAGTLPALCAALKEHAGSAEALRAMCDLAAEVCSARGAPAGSRRAMCEALAATGALKATLKALRGHVSHEGVASACCEVLLAYQEEFEGGSAPLPPLPNETLEALRTAQRLYSGNATVQLGATWAIGVGERRAAARRQQKGESKQKAQKGQGGADAKGTPKKARERAPAAAARPALQQVNTPPPAELAAPAAGQEGESNV